MIIDSHTHAYPPDMIADPRAWAVANNEPHWAELVAPLDRPSIQGWASQESMLTDMNEADIDKAVLLGWYWENLSSCQKQNDYYADCLKEHPERFIAFASIQAKAGDNAIDELKRARDNGFRGIGEIHPGAQGYDMQDACWLKIVEFAIEHNWPINMHVTEPVGRNHPSSIPTPFKDIQWLVENYPELTLILAHWGGLLPSYHSNSYIKKTFKNIYYDTAASPLLYGQEIHRKMVDLAGANKILFGTDYPLRIYPRKQKQPEFNSYLNEIKNSGLKEDELELILGKNAEQLFSA